VLRLRPLASSTLPAAGEQGWVEVAPRLGSLVLFWSHRIEHEVLPAVAPRFALSLWMHVDELQPAGWMD
jgi:SM-20-related protein